jgi:hypothetical protein
MLQRFFLRFKERPLDKPHLGYLLWRYVANGSRTRGALRARPEFSDTEQISNEMKERGIVVGGSSQFLTAEGNEALEEASREVMELSRSPDVQAIASGKMRLDKAKKEYLIRLVTDDRELSTDHPLARIALDPKLLELISSYLGMWPRLFSVEAWLNYPTELPAKDAQLWHHDPEDFQVVKVFIYLNDVDENLGPFSYIPKTQPFGAETARIRQYVGRGRTQDEEISVGFPPDTWCICTGPAHTMIIADTIGYHRGGKPVSGNRILIRFTYTSGAPFKPPRHRVKARSQMHLSDIQRSALG